MSQKDQAAASAVEDAMNKGAVDVEVPHPKTSADCAIGKTCKMSKCKPPSPVSVTVNSQKPAGVFADFDFADFWDNNEYSRRAYVGAPLTDAMVKAAESDLGYKLPASYIEFLRFQNGGTPKKTAYPTTRPTSWAANHVAITGIFGCDPKKGSDLVGSNHNSIDEWQYPRIGVYFCDCPSAGHDMICLDYRVCGPQGEPKVVHVDQEGGYRITPVADSFEQFIKGLVDSSVFDEMM